MRCREAQASNTLRRVRVDTPCRATSNSVPDSALQAYENRFVSNLMLAAAVSLNAGMGMNSNTINPSEMGVWMHSGCLYTHNPSSLPGCSTATPPLPLPPILQPLRSRST